VPLLPVKAQPEAAAQSIAVPHSSAARPGSV
jgi:hypothetical protein